MLKEIFSDKINDTKNAPFFLLQAPTHHSFTFNLRFLYELKHMFRLSKTVCKISHFRFRFAFIKVYIFVYIFIFYILDSSTLKPHNYFQN